MKNYKISVITPSYNMGKFIEENIISVLKQTYRNWEHIIVDGDSKDNTITILKKYSHLNWISEPDEGQSDAYNKALRMATGDLVLCLNADDYLLDNEVFEKVIIEINKIDFKKYSAFMGNINVCDEIGDKIGEMNNRNLDYSFDDLLNKLPIVIHPGTFFKRNLLQEVGGFSNKFHYQMDYDVFLNVSKKLPIHSINVFVSALRRHDSSKGMSHDNWKFSLEFIKLRKKYGGGFLERINFQPFKNIIYHYLGDNIVTTLKNSEIIYWISNKIGVTKLNKLTWYDDDIKK